MRTLVVVLNYRGAAVLLPCLRSLSAQLTQDDAVLVVDNGGEDTLMATVRQAFPNVTILTPGENLGFSRAVNVGLRYSVQQKYAATWLVNNDTVIEPGALTALKSVATKHPGVQLFSPLIMTPGGAVWFAGGTINPWRMRTEHCPYQPQGDAPFKTGFLTGCALFIPHETVSQVGLFDERYFLYYEDADYSTRVIERGGELWVVPQARVIHSEESRQNPNKLYWLVRSGTEYFFERTSGIEKAWIYVYFCLRRLKNKLRLWVAPGPVAAMVERAYTDALKARP